MQTGSDVWQPFNLPTLLSTLRAPASAAPYHPPTKRTTGFLLSCPALTQFPLITRKVYIKAGKIYRSATRQSKKKQDYPQPSHPELLPIQPREFVCIFVHACEVVSADTKGKTVNL